MNDRKKYIYCCLSAILFLIAGNRIDARPIVPGLYGFGTETRAAYGAQRTPEICIVDSLGTATGNPTWTPTGYSVGVFKGSLNQCIEGLDTTGGETISGHVVPANSGKIILFEVSGTIRQTGSDGSSIFQYSLGSYTSLYGQTAPMPGILLRNILLKADSKHDIVIQHIRGRMDGPPTLIYGSHKSFSITSSGSGSTSNIVVDHISSSWGTDVNFGCYSDGTGSFGNITIANSIIAEPRKYNSIINEGPSDVPRNLLVGGGNNSSPRNVAVLNNLMSNSGYRNPQIKTSTTVSVNNYLYNNKSSGTLIVGDRGSLIVSLVGNVQDGGPMSGTYATTNFPNFAIETWATPISQHSVYLLDNKTEAGTQSSSSDWSMIDLRPGAVGVYGHEADSKVTGSNPAATGLAWPSGLVAMRSADVKSYIINNAGAYPAFRDSIDSRLISEMTNGTGPSDIVTGAPSAGEWPVLAEHTITLEIPDNPHAVQPSGYTNLEEWIHNQASIVEGTISSLPAPSSIQITF